METNIINQNDLIIQDVDVDVRATKPFIEANTKPVKLKHLKDDCIIPVFSKDNEMTISHYQFIEAVNNMVHNYFPDEQILAPDIRVSHVIKGRVPSAIGKPVKELLEEEKTIYYERCAFIIQVPSIQLEVNNNHLGLTIGGVRAYNQENLYSKKSLERFKVFIGFRNKVCTNLCVSTDGILNDVRVGSVTDLSEHFGNLLHDYNQEQHLSTIEEFGDISITEEQFAHLIGKLRMAQYLGSNEEIITPMLFNDSQINNVVKNYYVNPDFGVEDNKSISLWKLYNLFTGSNKSSYVDSFLSRSVFAFEFVKELAISLDQGKPNWYLNN
ncbi:DUF3871 family protein [Mangrovimonas sp. ST2L15]|uniref:DUF3871 family protein n=1 Tax=Mangrovimonas sp. ST2L15 TaxID=1645916 RepID=UPI0006B4A2CB|nr:DUF3871 family protein [Mangrovimonas sp. ST2L15]